MKSLKFFFIGFFAVLLSSSYSINTPEISAQSACEIDTIEELIAEFNASNAYINFHTDNDDNIETTSGPHDLYTPGSVRGNIAPVATNDWEASIGIANQVLTHEQMMTGYWDPVNVPSMGNLELFFHAGHIGYEITLNPGLDNVVGIHIHQGGPTESNHLHLVDLKPTDITQRETITTLGGDILASDLCPGHMHGGGDDGGTHQGDLGDQVRRFNSIDGPLVPSTTVVLAGQVMQSGDYLPLVDYGSLDIVGHLSLRIPCNANSLPLVTPVAGHIDVEPEKTVLVQSHLMLVEHLSTPGKTCFYQANLPVFDGTHIESEGAPLISHIGLLNTCENNAVFRTGNVMSFTLQEVLGDINDNPYSNGPIIQTSADHTIIDLPNHDFIQGHVCGN